MISIRGWFVVHQFDFYISPMYIALTKFYVDNIYVPLLTLTNYFLLVLYALKYYFFSNADSVLSIRMANSETIKIINTKVLKYRARNEYRFNAIENKMNNLFTRCTNIIIEINKMTETVKLIKKKNIDG